MPGSRPSARPGPGADARDAFGAWAGLRESDLAELLALVAGSDVVELHVAFGSGQLTLRRSPTPPAAEAPAAGADRGPPAADSSLAITSPLVGIFHPAVQPGDRVLPGQPLGAIEALGMPTSVDAPQGGTVAELLASDGSPVEYGQSLLVLRRDGPGPEPDEWERRP